jgi:hypothetical protein
MSSLKRISLGCQANSLQARITDFEFNKSRQLFLIRTHNETLSIAAVRINNPDRSPFGIKSGDPAPTPTGLLRLSAMISEYFTRAAVSEALVSDEALVKEWDLAWRWLLVLE